SSFNRPPSPRRHSSRPTQSTAITLHPKNRPLSVRRSRSSKWPPPAPSTSQSASKPSEDHTQIVLFDYRYDTSNWVGTRASNSHRRNGLIGGGAAAPEHTTRRLRKRTKQRLTCPRKQPVLQAELHHAWLRLRRRLRFRAGLQLWHEQVLGLPQPRPPMEGHPLQVRRGRGGRRVNRYDEFNGYWMEDRCAWAGCPDDVYR
ncbi:hypothetical protein F5X68DRAFT_77274, partial [Plectosphaerella plurivora]